MFWSYQSSQNKTIYAIAKESNIGEKTKEEPILFCHVTKLALRLRTWLYRALSKSAFMNVTGEELRRLEKDEA